jgi:membrane-associated phospholipid phosphatase
LLLAWIQWIDSEALLFLQETLRFDWLSQLMEGYTTLGDKGLMWIVLALGLLCFKQTRKAGVLALVAMLFGLIGTNLILKNLVARPRPWLVVDGLLPLMSPPDPNSFPSGHTCAAFAFAGTMCRGLKWRWAKVTAVMAALLMGFSRLYVGLHFPTDVLMGMCVGLLCSQAAWYLGCRLGRSAPG